MYDMGMSRLAFIEVTNSAGLTVLVAADDVLWTDPAADGTTATIYFRSGRPPLPVKHTAAAVGSKLKAKWDESRAKGATNEIVTKTGAYTATASDYTILCDATAAAFTVMLPAAASEPGRIYVIKKIDASANAITIDGSGAETIDGAATKSLATQWTTMMIQSNGTAWFILAAGAAA